MSSHRPTPHKALKPTPKATHSATHTATAQPVSRPDTNPAHSTSAGLVAVFCALLIFAGAACFAVSRHRRGNR